jgi:hypothetical protein
VSPPPAGALVVVGFGPPVAPPGVGGTIAGVGAEGAAGVGGAGATVNGGELGEGPWGRPEAGALLDRVDGLPDGGHFEFFLLLPFLLLLFLLFVGKLLL